jgi:hypothetical protein
LDASGDLKGSTLRKFGLGTEILLVNYARSAGYDRVTDWQYYIMGIDKDNGL